MWGLNWPSSRSTQKFILYMWLSVLLEQSGQLRSFPPWKTLAIDISLSLGLHSTPDLCLWLRLLRISCSDSSKFCSEAVLSDTALPLKRSVWLFYFSLVFCYLGSLTFSFYLLYSWPVSIVGSIVLKGVTRRNRRTWHQHLKQCCLPIHKHWRTFWVSCVCFDFPHYMTQASPELTRPSLNSTGWPRTPQAFIT